MSASRPPLGNSGRGRGLGFRCWRSAGPRRKCSRRGSESRTRPSILGARRRCRPGGRRWGLGSLRAVAGTREAGGRDGDTGWGTGGALAGGTRNTGDTRTGATGDAPTGMGELGGTGDTGATGDAPAGMGEPGGRDGGQRVPGCPPAWLPPAPGSERKVMRAARPCSVQPDPVFSPFQGLRRSPPTRPGGWGGVDGSWPGRPARGARTCRLHQSEGGYAGNSCEQGPVCRPGCAAPLSRRALSPEEGEG